MDLPLKPESWADGHLTALSQGRKATVCVEFVSGTEAPEGGLHRRLPLPLRNTPFTYSFDFSILSELANVL